MAKVEHLNNQQTSEDAADSSLLESARDIGKRAINYSADFAMGTSYAASGGRLGVTMREARRARQDESHEEPHQKPEVQ